MASEVPKYLTTDNYRTDAAPSLPLMATEIGAVLAPMRQGLRIATGAEIARLGAPLTPVQLQRAETEAAELVALGEPVEAEPWAGVRPCMPDMLPVLGKAPRHPGLWLNFGHGHQGFTLGPTSAILLGEAMSAKPSPLMAQLAPQGRPLCGLC
ncbi:NAD(P)/FAD-dependent oxidoreductase [Afifella pfennigii]|uniref:NAD(P)/FAD-dependent oxidoreductase n=1 Tax=Afifella pfennigii TaxID=209897 RepID=UPI00047A717D|nr:FAD-binding oxidoreductase [Afifella pfennigii]